MRWHNSSYLLGRCEMESLTERIQDIEKEEILNALMECNWVMSKAARKLGITERMIGYKIKKYRIKKEVKYIEDDFSGNG